MPTQSKTAAFQTPQAHLNAQIVAREFRADMIPTLARFAALLAILSALAAVTGAV